MFYIFWTDYVFILKDITIFSLMLLSVKIGTFEMSLSYYTKELRFEVKD